MKKQDQTHLLNHIKILEKRLNSPKTDLVETDNTVIVRMELPVSTFEWSVKDGTILYVILHKDYTYSDEERIIYTETNYGKTTRRVKLPCKITECISESWENGIWYIVFEKEKSKYLQKCEPDLYNTNNCTNGSIILNTLDDLSLYTNNNINTSKIKFEWDSMSF